MTIEKKRWTPDEIDDLCERAYRVRLEDDCRGNVDRMIEKDKDGGEKLRARSRSYRPFVMATLQALDLVDSAPAPKRKNDAA